MRTPQPIAFTTEGFDKVQKEHQELILRRKDAVIQLRTAREMGDLSENGAYKAARHELSTIDRRLRHLNMLLRFGRVVEKKTSNQVDIGSTVVVDDGNQKREFVIVGNFESNPIAGKISTISPIGRALMGKRIDDSVNVQTPSGIITYTVRKIY